MKMGFPRYLDRLPNLRAIDVQHQLRVAYFACCIVIWGTSTLGVIPDMWCNNY